MASPGQFTAGDVLAAADMNGLPGGVLGYAEVTANQTGIGTSTVDLTGLSVIVNVIAARRIRVSGHGRLVQQGAAGVPRLVLREGSTILGTIGQSSTPGSGGGAGASGLAAMDGSVILTPSAGSHTYKLSAVTSNNTVDLQASSDNSAYILVEDIGPA